MDYLVFFFLLAAIGGIYWLGERRAAGRRTKPYEQPYTYRIVAFDKHGCEIEGAYSRPPEPPEPDHDPTIPY